MPSSLKELSRLVDGLTLVLKEAASHGGGGRGGASFQSGATDLQTLIKRALLSATDLTGLTKGNLREFSVSRSDSDDSRSKGSVVYFTDQPETPAAHPISTADLSETPSSSSSSTTTNGGANANESSQFVPNANREPDDVLPAASSSPADAIAEIAGGEAAAVITPPPPPPPPTVIKRRKLRERRVPSTTFSRALG